VLSAKMEVPDFEDMKEVSEVEDVEQSGGRRKLWR
jgi:hypothetical protein